MAHFGETLFGGGGCIRWSITPFLIVVAVAMPILLGMAAPWNPAQIVMIASIELPCLALLAGFWLPPWLGRWGYRAVAACVFVAYTVYLIDELCFAPPRPPGAPTSLSKALMGFVVIGIPCLYFTVFGRFRTEAEPTTQPEYFEPPPDDEAI